MSVSDKDLLEVKACLCMFEGALPTSNPSEQLPYNVWLARLERTFVGFTRMFGVRSDL